MLTRYDTAPINKITQDASTGFVHIKDVPIARVGVFPYLKADGSIEMEAKLPTELLADSTVQSAENKPVTDNHPSELVTQINSKEYMKGFTATNAHVENDTLKVDMTITDADLIKEISKGKQELSIGFETEVVPQKGEYKGVGYDSVQKNIQINHVAVVERGRAGHSVRLIGDSAEMVNEKGVPKKGQQMDVTKVRLGDTDITVATSDASKIVKVDADNSEKEKKIAELNEQIEKLQAEKKELEGDAEIEKKSKDEAQAKADAAEKELEALKKKYEGDGLDKVVNDRLKLIETINPYVGDSFDYQGKSDKELKVETLKKLDDSLDLNDKSDDYINAYFDAQVAKMKNQTRVNGYSGPNHTNENDSDDLEKLRMARYHLADKGGNK